MSRIAHHALFAATTALSLALFFACSSEPETDDDATSSAAGGGVDDGRLRPEPNGVHISEADACDQLRGALATKVQELACTKTLRACPNFLRATYGAECAEFDQGSVQGCVDHWNGIFNCSILDEDDCVVTHYPETAPAGCP